MASARITKLLLLYALATASYGVAAQQPLQFTIYQTSTEPTFQAELYNSGKETLNLSFGEQDEIGHAMSAIRIAITDAQGKKVTLDMRDPYRRRFERTNRRSTCAMLSPGRTYSLSIDLDDYLTQPLAPGRYSLQAIYTGADMGLTSKLSRNSGQAPSTPTSCSSLFLGVLHGRSRIKLLLR